MLIEKILSGDQSGVDWAARDVAKVLSIPWGGYSQADIIVSRTSSARLSTSSNIDWCVPGK